MGPLQADRDMAPSEYESPEINANSSLIIANDIEKCLNDRSSNIAFYLHKLLIIIAVHSSISS